ncbi:hypothetical protein LLH23_24060, partial [bacterium]|nr:hypothetical protein [bacterium]
YFPESVRAKLRTQGEQFRLAQAPDGAWQLRPTDYAAHRITSLTDGTQGWTTTNRFAAQPAKLRVEALYACAPYDSPDAVVLSDFSRPEDFGVKVTAQGVTQQLTTATQGIRGGATGGCLTAKNATAARRGAWTKLGQVFTPPLNMARCGALGVWVYGDGKGELLNFQLNNCPEYYTAWDDHYVDVNFTGWRYFELLLRERDAQRHQDYIWPYGGPCEVGRTPLQRGRVGAFNIYTNDLPPGEAVQCTIGPVKALPALKVRLNNPTVSIGGKRLVFPVSLESGQYIEYEGPDDCCVRDERGEIITRVTPQGDAPVLAAGDNAMAFACDQPEGCQARARVTVIGQGAPLAGAAPKQAVDWQRLRTEYDAPRTIQALDGKQNQWTMARRPGVKSAAFQVDLVVERTAGRSGTPEEAKPLVIEGCENATGFADTPDNKYTQYVYDGEVQGVAAKPGVTVKLEPVSNPVKAGQGSLRLSATSTRGDGGGWCARGRRFATPLNLTDYSALGCWVYGDAGGQSLKLQLRDTAGGWQDMVTPVDFTGWKRVEFPLGGRATVNLSQVEYLIVFFNGVPSGRTVSCCLDEIQALRDSGNVSRPAFTVNGKTLTFPVTMGTGERLAYSGSGEATVYGRDGLVRQRCRPEGAAPTLKPGSNQVRFSFDSKSVGDFSLRVQVVKQYPQ